MGSSLHNKIYLGGRHSCAQEKRWRIFASLFAVACIAALALAWLA
jgi:hypothetical protein